MAWVEVEGGRRLRSSLKKAGVDMKRLSAINRKAATMVANAARPATPRLTGRLAASVRAGATQRAGVVRAGRKSLPYAGPIHWGWPRRGIRPQPWIATTASATEGAWVPLYERHMKEIVKEVKGK